MTDKESMRKIIIIASLFHDIGKFEQRCTNKKIKHQELAITLLDEFSEEFIKILDGEDNFKEVKNLIFNHHNRNESYELLDILKDSDHLSASERVGFDKEDDFSEKWSHKYLSSLFSKVCINNSNEKNQRYYYHKTLNKKDYKILIPKFDNENDLIDGRYSYKYAVWDEDFKKELKAVLQFYKEKTDFYSLVNLLLILFEKYMWCIPDFTGSKHTDISLYNHLKDVTGIATAIYKSKEKEGTNLNLIIGDLPGIQKYIFNVANKKPAKVLRGRSIFVQILTRHFATIILKKLGLTEANLIMFAGGKFYILAQDSKDFLTIYQEAVDEIEKYLIENFNYQLSFSSAYETFDYTLLKDKNITFGDIIDKASYKLLLKRNQQFKSKLFNEEKFDEANFILSANYMKTEEDDTNKVKDAVTGLPIRKDHERKMPDSKDKEMIDKQVWNEIQVGTKIPQSNVVISFNNDFSDVKEVFSIDDYKVNSDNKILLNPDLEELLKKENLEKNILRNTQILEVANYTTWNESEDHVMDFEDIEKSSTGAEFLTLIKGDVDNLGLIMSSGLAGNKDIEENNKLEKDLTGISRTTTLSNHLKYFFSFSLNGFLRDWEDENDQKVYTVFAGGDDLMLVCPQSSSLKLLEAFNKTFNDFVCENPEVHISYSLTNFKHGTPFRIVADMAEDNQSQVKKELKVKKITERIDTEPKIFHPENDKAGTRLFETNVKNSELSDIFSESNELKNWVLNKNNKVSKGVLRNLLTFTRIMNDFDRTGDGKFLMWHPKLNYMINRLLKNSEGKYYNPEIEDFFENALCINKNTKEAIQLKRILLPVVCEAIYRTRNYKGE